MVFFVGLIDIIVVSILMKNLCYTPRNLTKKIKLHQILKNREQIEPEKN